MSKEVKVVYAVIADADGWAARQKCHPCGGVGEVTVRDGSGYSPKFVERFPDLLPGSVESCSRCKGDGVDPHPRAYAYLAADDVRVGDIMDCPTMFGAEVGTIVGIGPSDYDHPLRFATRRP